MATLKEKIGYGFWGYVFLYVLENILLLLTVLLFEYFLV